MSQAMDNYRQAVAMVTAPEAFLELTTIEQGGCTLKAYQHAPGSLRDLWLMGQGHGDKEYIVYGDERLTYAEAGQLVANFSAWLHPKVLARVTGSRLRCAIIQNGYWLTGASLPRARW